MLTPLHAAARNRLSFVLTIALSGTGRDEHDLLRARLMLKTLDRFFDKSSLEAVWVVAPGKDLSEVALALAPFRDSLRVEFVNENDICPEFLDDPDTTNLWPRLNKGWFRQQLIKLAIHQYVASPFYMTVDSDVLFVRDFGFDSLIANDRAALGVLTADELQVQFRPDVANHEVLVRHERVRQAERVLGLNRPQIYSGQWYSETPVLLSRDLVADLREHLTTIHQGPWRSALLECLPWTEYSLYFLMAECNGRLESYHSVGQPEALLRLSQSLWHPAEKYSTPRDLSNWLPEEIFNSQRDGIAVVVQSYLGYAVSDIESMVENFIH